MSIAVVEEALIAALTAALESRVREVVSLPGGWSEELVARVERDAPAAYVVFLRGLRGAPTQEVVINGQYAVYVVTANAVGQKARRQGDGIRDGAYTLLELAIAAVQGMTVEGNGSAELISVENLWEGAFERKGISIYAAVFSIPTTVGEMSLPVGVDDFETFDAVYPLGDGTSSPADIVILETV